MPNRQYVGARYVPKFFAGPDGSTEWIQDTTYEALTIVTYLGNSYTSKKAVPVGVEITNTEYWVLSCNNGSQLDAIKTDISNLQTDVSQLKTNVSTLQTDVSGLKTNVSTLQTDVSQIKASISTLQTNVSGLQTNVSTLQTDMETVKNGYELLYYNPFTTTN